MRWLLLDKFDVIEKGKLARSRSHVPSAEASKELLMVEMMAQTGAVLLGALTEFTEDVVFAKIESAEFAGKVQAGDPLEIEVTSECLRPEGAWLDGRISGPSGDEATARLLLMSVGNLNQSMSEPISFHAAFMDHFQVREKLREV